MTGGSGVVKLYEALELLQQASLLLESAGESVVVAHLALPIDILRDRLTHTMQ